MRKPDEPTDWKEGLLADAETVELCGQMLVDMVRRMVSAKNNGDEFCQGAISVINLLNGPLDRIRFSLAAPRAAIEKYDNQ